MRPNLVRRLLILGPAAVALSAASAVSAAPAVTATDVWDPWEKMNRRVFAIEEILDRHLVGPIALTFGKTPGPVRTVLRNFSRNLGEPVVAVNDLLQGRIGSAARTLGRFAINSIFGIAGLADPATATGVPHHDNDFGTTLGRWGAVPGPYLFLPFFGPSTLRDGFGSLADIGLNPLNYANYRYKTEVGIATTVIDEVDQRLDAQEDVQTIFQTSVDPYATLRSYYMQNRQAEIAGSTDIGPLPEIDDTAPAPEAPAAGAPTPKPEQTTPPNAAAAETTLPVHTAGRDPPPPSGPPAGSACEAPP